MPNAVNPRPIEPILKQVEALGIAPRTPLWQLFQDLALRSDKTQTNLGEIRHEANVTGRTEPLSSTLQNVTSAGELSSADHVAADGATFGRVNVTALTTNNVDLAKAGVTNKTAANISETSDLKWRTAAHSSTQPTNIVITGTDSGAGHAQISYPNFTMRVPGLTDYTVSNGLALGLNNSTLYYIYFDDSTFSGSGSLNVTTDKNAIFSSSSRFYFGKVTTPAGGAGPTTGTPGGTGGGLNRDTVLA